MYVRSVATALEAEREVASAVNAHPLYTEMILEVALVVILMKGG